MKKTQDFLKLAKKLQNIPYKKFIALTKKHPDKITQLLRAKSYYDIKFFAKYFFSDPTEEGPRKGHTSHPFNKMHLNFFKNYQPEEKNLLKVILAARGSAKTTLICLIYVLHKVCYNNEKYIMILSSTTPLSRQKSKDIHTEIKHNEKLQQVFKIDFEGKRTASSENFVVNSCFGDCKIQSQSFNSQIRGTKYKENRLTLVILDDVVHGEEVFSEEQRIKAERQLKTDIMQASQPGTNFVYIGTRIHDKDLGSELARDPAWHSEVYPAFEKWPERMDLWEQWEEILKDPTKTKSQKAILADKFYEKNKVKMTKGAKVLWPEREDVLFLMKERMKIGHKAFGAEKQMIAFLTSDTLFEDITWFVPKTIQGHYGFYLEKQDEFIPFDEARFTKYYSLDPATGEEKKQTQKKTLSQSARIIAAKDETTQTLYIIDAFMDRKPPLKIIKEMYDLHHHHDFHKMFFEENLFRDLYKGTIKSVGESWNRKYDTDLKLPTISIWNSQEKEQRIYALEPKVSMAKIVFNKHINPDFIAQIETYPNSDHNDGLDSLQILWQGINSHTWDRR